MQKEKLENLIKDFSLKRLDEFLFDANFTGDKEDFSSLNSENIFSDVQKLGEIETENDNKKIIVAVAKAKNDLSERSSRKKQYDLGKKILTNRGNYEAGIFVFYDKQGSFRFSLIYPTYSGTKRELSSFKRYTYFVSKEQTNKTFLSQIGEGDFSTLEKIKDAFSVEKVTKEFFKEYKNLFEKLVEEFNNNHTFKNEAARYNINTENFAKKLLGQIVFLCFLQKKCWLGASQNKSLKEGDENFLQNLFEKKYIKYSNFFNDVLEHLFYGALNKKSDKAGTFYRDYFKCQIPFLNGGLFDPEYEWQKTNIYLDDKIFEWILKVFNQYNFTVDENSPIDQEIAIDPEMLGKVFENLLNENLRKGKGTYYTPREIVHYMCQESLINYLATTHSSLNEKNIRTYIKYGEALSLNKDMSELKKMWKGEWFKSGQFKEIDDLLANIKVVDPACGSGAFLVGMLQEIVKLRIFLQLTHDSELFLGSSENTIKEVPEYILKKETIQNCIYGVDIDPGAIEIAKLRLWLSLVVDYDLEEIEPLPNLDYKIMQGNSLLEELVLGDTSIKLFDQEQNEPQATLLENEEQASVDELNDLHKKYFVLNNLEEKKKIKKEIENIEYEVIKKSVEKEVKKLESDNKKFEFVTMGGIKKKDVESFIKNLSKQGQIMNVLNDFKKTGVKPFFLWRLYFADVFEGGGFDVVIANPPYVFTRGSDFSKSFKKAVKEMYFCGKGKINLFSLFIERSSMILRKNGVYIYIIPNTFFRATSYKSAREYVVKNNKILQIVDLHDGVFENVTASTTVLEVQNINSINDRIEIVDNFKQIQSPLTKHRTLNQNDFNNYEFIFSIYLNEKSVAIIKKIKTDTFKLKDICKDIIEGIVTPKGKNLFISNKLKSDLYKPFLEGKDIDQYQTKWKQKYIKFDRKKLHRPRPDYLWDSQQKILIRRIAGGKNAIVATLDDEKFYTYASINNLLLKEKCIYDYKFILALLNSRLLNWYYIENFTNRSGLTVNISRTFLDVLPIKKISLKQQKPFINLVDQILKKKKENPTTDTGELERKIDEMVYELYNLTEDEIGVVESK